MQSLTAQGISVVIAAYNEKDNIRPLVAEILQVLGALDHLEVIVVDDASQDGTAQELAEISAQFPVMRPLYHSRNFGQTIAVITGVRAAQYKWIVTLDGDGQNDPADIPQLIAAAQTHLNAGPVLINGVRVKRHDNWIRRRSSKWANQIRGRLLQDDCPDSACGLKLFQREIFLQLPHFNHLHRFIPALYKRINATVINIPVNHRPRLRGQSKYGTLGRLRVGIADLFGVMWLSHRPCPLETRDVSST